MLKLKRREVTITSINVRGEYHGEEIKAAADYSLTFLVSRSELNSLMRRDEAADRLFEKKGEDAYEPYFGGVAAAIPCPGKFENSNATFFCGVENDIEVKVDHGTISGTHVTPQVGGMTLVECKLSALQTADMKQLQDWMRVSQKAQISIGKIKERAEQQKELPLGEAAPSTIDEALKADEAAANVEVSSDAKPAKAKRVRASRSKAAIAERKAAKGNGEARA